jgi:long-chain acyl-CoA synthetase
VSEAVNISEMLELAAKKYKRKDALYYEGKTISYRELDENSNKAANALYALGIRRLDRVALMLPNIPEFIYAFLGIQKIGAVAVPFNTMYKGREITHILNDSGAKAIICLSNFANLINEIREDCQALQHVILTGQRTVIPISPESTVNIQFVASKDQFDSPEDAFRDVGELLVATLQSFGVDAWYKHRGGVRVGGQKIASVLVSVLENMIMVNTLTFIGPMPAEELFKVVWVSPEIKDKILEPSTSILEATGKAVTASEFTEAFLKVLNEQRGIEAVPGTMKRDELFGYEKSLTLSKY